MMRYGREAAGGRRAAAATMDRPSAFRHAFRRRHFRPSRHDVCYRVTPPRLIRSAFDAMPLFRCLP